MLPVSLLNAGRLSVMTIDGERRFNINFDNPCAKIQIRLSICYAVE